MKADYRALIGHRGVNSLLVAMDLGTAGAYEPQTVTISWKPKTRVTMKRAEKLCARIKDGLNKLADTDCHSVEFLRLYEEPK